ncbi:Zinc finger C2H2 superfamily [Sergentomyia squamirostris]
MIVNQKFHCDFVQSLYQKLLQIHEELINHESLMHMCGVCSEKSNEILSFGKHLTVVVNINIFEEHLQDNQLSLTSIPDNQSVDSDVNLFEDSQDIENTALQPSTTKVNLSYECYLCQMKVSRKCHLVQHMQSHLQKNQRRKSSTKRSSRKEAKQKLIPDKGKKKCPFCNRVYKTRHECNFRQPRRETVFSCAFCPETFSKYPKIYFHHKVHHPKEPVPLSPFQCDVCGKFAIQLCALNIHKKIHTDYFPFSCDVCPKQFRTREKLQEHLRKHIPKGEKDDKYKCEICNKRFTFRQSWVKHKKLQHNDDRILFPCSICGGKFITETSLHKHQLIHAGKAPRAHKCDQCGRIFEKLKYFNQHRKKQHNIFTSSMLNSKKTKITE